MSSKIQCICENRVISSVKWRVSIRICMKTPLKCP
uniref:Uncharacterized protein n=1 Tax=Setaria italica TaxID=4555 RepID=K3Z146_SETIT